MKKVHGFYWCVALKDPPWWKSNEFHKNFLLYSLLKKKEEGRVDLSLLGSFLSSPSFHRFYVEDEAWSKGAAFSRTRLVIRYSIIVNKVYPKY